VQTLVSVMVPVNEAGRLPSGLFYSRNPAPVPKVSPMHGTSTGPCLAPAQTAIFVELQTTDHASLGLEQSKAHSGAYFRRMKIGVPSAGPNAMTSDLALVTASRSGDQGAMTALYDRYSSIVYSVALRVLQDTGAAEDVLQDIFMQLWRNPGAFDATRGNMAAWLAVIARNRAIDALRRRRPENNDIEDVVVSVEHDLASEADRSRTMDKVRGALQAMPAPQRSALEMAYFEGLTHSEIAGKTGEPLGTVKTRIRSGLLTLRRVLAA
jgi:RNA polymerase sigma-70 factor (ECF subfamily)